MSDEFKDLLTPEELAELPADDVLGEEITQEDMDNAPTLQPEGTSEDPIYLERELFGDTLKSLVNSLPGKYNKETNDTNYYKLLRSLALELSNAKIEVTQLKDDMYLSTVQPSSIYNNFGALVKLTKNSDWDSEKYRRLIQGVMQSLLRGPTKQSLIDGLNLFTDFKINLYELYKEEDRLRVDPSLYKDINYQYSFVLEIEKPVEAFADQQVLIRDANYIVNIIKPAHTISIIITTIVGEESYRQSYRERFNIDSQVLSLPEELQQFGLPDYHGMDKVQTEAEINHKDNIFGYKFKGDGVFGVGSIIGGEDLIGPVYFLEDVRSDWYFEQWLEELYDKLNIELSDTGLEYADGKDWVANLTDLVPHLGVDYAEWFKTLQLENKVSDLQYDLSDAYDKTKNTEKLNSHLELVKSETHILSNEVEEYDDKNVEMLEEMETPSMSRSALFSLTWEESYPEYWYKGRFSLSSYTLGSRLNGGTVLVGAIPDIVDNVDIDFYDKVNTQSFQDTLTGMLGELFNSENVNTTTKVKDDFVPEVIHSETYENPEETVTHMNSMLSENVYFTSITDEFHFDYEDPWSYFENYETPLQEASYSTHDDDVLPMVPAQMIPRFVFNQTITGKGRLGGVIHDQLTMKLEPAIGSPTEAVII